MFNHKKLPIMVLNYCILDTKSVIQNSSVLKKKTKIQKSTPSAIASVLAFFPNNRTVQGPKTIKKNTNSTQNKS